MKPIHAILLCLLVMAGSGAYALFAPVGGAPAGMPHPEHPAMLAGGDGAARFEPIGWAAFIFQCASLIAGAFLMSLGVRPERRTRMFWLLMTGCTILVLGAWFGLFFSYTDYLNTGETSYFLGFPVPTAWMIYGTWGSALGFAALFVLGFRVYVLPKEDEEAFEALARELREKQGGA